MDNCVKIRCLVPFFYRFIYVDTREHHSGPLLKALGIHIWHTRELVKSGSSFRLVLCYVRKKDLNKFCEMLEMLSSKVLLLGYKDYQIICFKLKETERIAKGLFK